MNVVNAAGKCQKENDANNAKDTFFHGGLILKFVTAKV
ncbi:hypothetical protein SDC9_209123 [bioreactor metagenome]|uniref:Uncharacterized protein n=1 Tax=bioreactor metagenome TaxID=1076179 RepID=A0A645JD59_9ZZZZ